MYRLESEGGGEASLFIQSDAHPVARVHKAHQQPGMHVSISVHGPMRPEDAMNFCTGLLQLLTLSGLETRGIFDHETSED